MKKKQPLTSSEAKVSQLLSPSRLKNFCQLLNISPTEAINSLPDWAETGACLAQFLKIENPTPEALSDKVKVLENTVEHLIKALSEAENEIREYRSSGKAKKCNTKKWTKKRILVPEERERDTGKVMEADVNAAVNAIMEFNNAPDRPFKQKFRISIAPVAELTGRATNSVSSILKERRSEIEDHHLQHKITNYHNRSRRDQNGDYYLSIKSEPEINYYRITQVSNNALYGFQGST